MTAADPQSTRQRIADQWAGIVRRQPTLSLEAAICGALATYETERARVGEQAARVLEDVVAAHAVYRSPCDCRLCRVVREYRAVVPAAKEGR